MKKIILPLILLAVTAAGCNSLRIVMDSHDSNGSRILLTSDKHLFGSFSVALGAKINQRDTVLGILVTSDKASDHGIFVKGDKMLLRLSDESVITLENLYDREYDKETTEQTTTERVSSYGFAYSYSPFVGDVMITPYELSSFVPRTYVSTTTNSYALYLVSKKDMDDIIAKGVVKLRIEIEDAEKDMTATEGVSKILASQRDCLRKGASVKVKHSEF